MGKVLKNTFYSSISFGFRFASNALLFIIIARVLGMEEFGRFAFALSFIGIFLIVVDYGFNLLIVREVAVSPAEALNIFRGVFSGKVVLSLASTIILFITLKMLGYPPETEMLIYVLWASAILFSFGSAINALFRGLNKFQYEAYPTVVLNVIQVFLAVAFLLSGFKALSVAFSYLASRAVYFAYSLALAVRHIGNFRLAFDAKEGIKVLKGSLPFGVHAVLATLYFQLDTVFLSYYKGNAEVGRYQAAMRLVLASMLIYEVVVSAYFPIMAGKIKTDMAGFKKYGLMLNKYMLMLGGAIGAFFFLFPEAITGALYGAEYASSAKLLYALSAVVFLRFLGGSYAVFITAADSQSRRAIGVALSLAVNVFLNIYLIPRYGAMGAAAASIITHAFLAAIYVIFAFGLTKETFVDSYCLRALLIIVIALIVIKSGFFLQPVSMAIFALSLVFLAFFALNAEEKAHLRAIFNKLTLRTVPE